MQFLDGLIHPLDRGSPCFDNEQKATLWVERGGIVPDQRAEAGESGTGVPEYYTNSVRVTVSAWDVLMEHSVRGGHEEEPRAEFVQRTSIEHAWVFQRILHRVLMSHIAGSGPLAIPQTVLEELDLVDEYEADMSREE